MSSRVAVGAADLDVEHRNYSTRYRPELDLVLKDLNIKIVRPDCCHDFGYMDADLVCTEPE